jgi:hypothetical protein
MSKTIRRSFDNVCMLLQDVFSTLYFDNQSIIKTQKMTDIIHMCFLLDDELKLKDMLKGSVDAFSSVPRGDSASFDVIKDIRWGDLSLDGIYDKLELVFAASAPSAASALAAAYAPAPYSTEHPPASSAAAPFYDGSMSDGKGSEDPGPMAE